MSGFTQYPSSGLTDEQLRADPVDIHLLEPSTGFHARMTPIGDLRVVEPFRLVGTVYGSSIDTRTWTASNVGAGSAAGVANGVATLTSGTANNGYGQITTVRAARFIFAHPHQFRGSARLPDITEANNTRRIGAYTISGTSPQDGFAFELDGTGVLSCVAYRGGSVSYSASSGSFNGDSTTYVLDTNVHAFEILHFVMGAWFYIDGALVHKIVPTTTPLANTLNLPCTAQTINSASGTESSDLEVWSMNIARLGRETTAPMTYYHAAGTTVGTTLKAGPGILRSIVFSQISVNSSVTIYDNTSASGTVLFTSGSLPATTTPFYLEFNELPFFTGLTFVVSTAACSLVFSYE